MLRSETTQRIVDAGAVAIIRMQSSDGVLRVAEALLEGGIRILEVTLTTPRALTHIASLAQRLSPSMLIGVGSVLQVNDVKRAVDVGAQFVVSPITKPAIIAAAHERNVPVIPGAFTPTEAQHASECGADIIKIFPAQILGKQFISALLAPLPHLKIMPTGGVSPGTAGEWIQMGAAAVGIGGSLLDKHAIAEGRYDVLTKHARALCHSIAKARA